MSKEAKLIQKAELLKLKRPIHISNLKVCTDENKPVKLKVRIDEQGEREFVL